MALKLVSDILSWIVMGGLVLAGILAVLIWVRNRTKKLSVLRFVVQIASLLLIFYSFTFSLWLLYFLIAIYVATLFTGRFFCGWICPFGFYMDLISLIRKRLRIRYFSLPEKLNKALHWLRYPIAVTVLLIPLYLGALNYSLNSPLLLFLRGPFKPYIFLLAPLEPLVLPWGSIFTLKGYSLSYPYAREITFYAGGSAGTDLFIYTFLGLTVAATFAFRRFWCRFCPTGISIGIINRFKGLKWAPLLHLNKVEEKCTKCGVCKRVCPQQVTEVYDKKGGDITTSMCMVCLRCVEMCPYEGCLKVNFAGKTAFQSRNWLEPSISK